MSKKSKKPKEDIKDEEDWKSLHFLSQTLKELTGLTLKDVIEQAVAPTPEHYAELELKNLLQIRHHLSNVNSTAGQEMQ